LPFQKGGMTMRGFREVGWVAAVAGTALGCYMVSLQVASERAALEDVQNRIVLAQRDIRVLQTEIGTRGRLEQLESWNVKVLALSAPQAHQFLEGEFQLATLSAPKKTMDPAAPVVLASAPAPSPQRQVTSDDEGGATARDLMQVASLKRDLPQPEQKTVDKAQSTTTKPVKTAQAPATAPVKVAAKAVTVTSSQAKPKEKTVVPASAKAEPKAKVVAAASAKADTKIKKPAQSSKPKDIEARQ
jgi:hypothetical protein